MIVPHAHPQRLTGPRSKATSTCSCRDCSSVSIAHGTMHKTEGITEGAEWVEGAGGFFSAHQPQLPKLGEQTSPDPGSNLDPRPGRISQELALVPAAALQVGKHPVSWPCEEWQRIWALLLSPPNPVSYPASGALFLIDADFQPPRLQLTHSTRSRTRMLPSTNQYSKTSKSGSNPTAHTHCHHSNTAPLEEQMERRHRGSQQGRSLQALWCA